MGGGIKRAAVLRETTVSINIELPIVDSEKSLTSAS